MRQRIMIKVPMTGAKSRAKALKIAVGVPGVESAALSGLDKSLLEVTGDGIDSVVLTTLLRKGVGFSELVSVGPLPLKKDGSSSYGYNSGGIYGGGYGSGGGYGGSSGYGYGSGGYLNKNDATMQVPVGGYYSYPYTSYTPGPVYDVRSDPDHNCSIM